MSFMIVGIKGEQLLYTGKISPRFIFALWPEGKFKTGPIELYIKDYVRKLEGV